MIEDRLEKMAIKEKLLEGERLMDNKTFYKESDVDAFMKSHFDKEDDGADDNGDAPEDTGSDPAGTDGE